MFDNNSTLIKELAKRLELKEIIADTTLESASLEISSFEELKEFIRRFSNRYAPSTNLVELLEEEVDIVLHKLKFIASESRPKILLLESITPPALLESTLIAETIQIAGGLPIPLQDYQQAQILIIKQDEFTLYGQLPDFVNQDQWKQIPAIKNNQVYLIKKEDFAGIPGTNFLTELELLAEIIQPKYFVFGHQGIHWIKFDLI